MKQTLTIDILDEKAVRLLHDLEVLQLIRVHTKKDYSKKTNSLAAKYKGAMQKQPVHEVDNQLENLRNAWE
ncbi:MAG: hypothetical protein ACQERU_11595 [Bacteroidota bacterium]